MFRILVWFLILVVVELAIALVMLGSWLIEGRRRAEEIERLTDLWRAGPPHADLPDLRGVSGPAEIEQGVRPESVTRWTG
jgi:hypothetical protein